MKKSLRALLLAKRDSITKENKKIKDSAIRKRLFSLEYFKEAKTILFYASFRSEAETLKAIQNTLKLNKRVALPVVDTEHKQLKLYEVHDISELSPGYMGIPEPVAVRALNISLNEIDIEIIPGIGFDPKGNRLGYGSGYYDKLLSHKSKRLSKTKGRITTIALAFEEQIAEKIPSEPHDIRVDLIVTDKRLIRCKD
ncbi:MAG: 5-formyltetrahydrofolate cyclo-ligase [Nitrospirae bacterium]|nr:5-formyltetrahydrofolate cyclo-ligase [Nitrospirota bacterium]